ncbi:group XV phospholipase A2-like isoform X2 [Contarinia nasturtii]|uniref:group XV phospholipase A2-like isoform X2 n=1 Tax=Contarinia nasturtii TaxID=265458 RepID=UPI0012D472FA|nr:group XV phospholipase A2-like isoform X2 [Contarinia nasturtii]
MKSPVILIPGLEGSTLEAKLDKPNARHWWCFKKSDYFNLWLSVYPVLSFDCWLDNLKLEYDPVRRKTKNSPITRVPAWGETKTIEWIGEYFGAFYYFIVDALVERGYVRGQNLFGAPYDFCNGPSKQRAQILVRAIEAFD